MVARTLTRLPYSDSLPEMDLHRAHQARLETAIRNLAVHTELLRIAKALHAQGIPTVPLKGTSLALRVYGALDCRQVGDIDILVPTEGLAAARDEVVRLGYGPVGGVSPLIEAHPFHGVPWVRGTSALTFVLELHWGLNDPRFVNVQYDDLWRRIREMSTDGDVTRPLPVEETLVFQALHLPKHPVGVLRLLLDIDRLIRSEGDKLDWPYALALAERWNVAAMLYYALTRAAGLLRTPIPSWTLRRLQPTVWRRAAVSVLAGPAAIARGKPDTHLTSNRSDLAYCAMVQPLRRSIDAYSFYLFPAASARTNRAARMLALGNRLAHGIGWTALIVAAALGDELARLFASVGARSG